MKLIFAILLTTCYSLSFWMQANPLPIGSAMPKGGIKMKDVSGKLISLQDVKTSNGLLVIFNANACPYVLKNQARTSDIAQYAQQKSIGIVVLNANEGYRHSEDSYAAMQKYAVAQSYKWPYAMDSDSELADAFGATRAPECFLFDGKGILVYHGAIDDNPADETKIKRQHLKEAINEMLAGKEITIKESIIIGCAIKRKG
jgi:hypothetical protein